MKPQTARNNNEQSKQLPAIYSLLYRHSAPLDLASQGLCSALSNSNSSSGPNSSPLQRVAGDAAPVQHEANNQACLTQLPRNSDSRPLLLQPARQQQQQLQPGSCCYSQQHLREDFNQLSADSACSRT